MSKQDSEKTIQERIVSKRNKLLEIHAMMSVHMTHALPREKRAKVSELQHRLEYRTWAYEEQLLDDKIEIYQKVLDALK